MLSQRAFDFTNILNNNKEGLCGIGVIRTPDFRLGIEGFIRLNYNSISSLYSHTERTKLNKIESLIYYMKKTSNWSFPSTESNRFLRPNLTGGDICFDVCIGYTDSIHLLIVNNLHSSQAPTCLCALISSTYASLLITPT